MVPAGSRRISRVPRYSGAALAYMGRFRVRGSHPLRPRFPAPSATAPLCRIGGPTTPRGALPHPRFGLLRVRSPLLAQSFLFSLPAGTGMFRFPAFARPAHAGRGRLAPPGFPHSDIRGSRSICLSPRLFAAYHVLRRLREPQASPVRPFLLSCIFRLYDLATSGSLDSRYF